MNKTPASRYVCIDLSAYCFQFFRADEPKDYEEALKQYKVPIVFSFFARMNLLLQEQPQKEFLVPIVFSFFARMNPPPSAEEKNNSVCLLFSVFSRG